LCGRNTKYIDTQGNNWVASSPYIVDGASPLSVSNAIDGTFDDPIHQTQNWKNDDLLLDIDVTPGPYDVILHFAEIYWGAPHSRVVSVRVEGQEVESNFDIFQATGGKFRAVFNGKEVYVSDGLLKNELGQIVEKPTIAGIEVYFLLDPKTLSGAPSQAPSISEQPSASPTDSPAPTVVPPQPVWSGPYKLPLVAVAAANLPNEGILFW
jgi:Malectin domain